MDLQTLSFEGLPLRAVIIGGHPALIARQVGAALGYQHGGKALVSMIRREWALEFEEGRDYSFAKGVDFAPLKDTRELSSPRGHMVLFESGLYLACILSRKPAGRRLRRWLADDVLPQIRKTGQYVDPGLSVAPAESGPDVPTLADPPVLDERRQALAEARELRQMAEALGRAGAKRAEVAGLLRKAAQRLSPGAVIEVGSLEPEVNRNDKLGADLAWERERIIAVARQHADGPQWLHAGEWVEVIDRLGPHETWGPGKHTQRSKAVRFGGFMSQWLGIPLQIAPEGEAPRWVTAARRYPRGPRNKPIYAFVKVDPAEATSEALSGARDNES